MLTIGAPACVSETLDHACDVLSDNATVATLSDFGVRAQLASALAEKSVHCAVLMTQKARKSKTAVALYAGDGIVVKVTHKDALEHSIDARLTNKDVLQYSIDAGHVRDGKAVIPHVLPPLQHFDVGDLRVEMFPWIDRSRVTNADVAQMKKALAVCNLRFKPGDDRRDNLGVLPGPGHMLAVLDGDAVEPLNPDFGILTQDSRRWEKKVHALFSPLYREGRKGEALVSSDPDFRESYSPLIAEKAARASTAGDEHEGWRR